MMSRKCKPTPADIRDKRVSDVLGALNEFQVCRVVLSCLKEDGSLPPDFDSEHWAKGFCLANAFGDQRDVIQQLLNP